jgi:hypothetical protein
MQRREFRDSYGILGRTFAVARDGVQTGAQRGQLRFPRADVRLRHERNYRSQSPSFCRSLGVAPWPCKSGEVGLANLGPSGGSIENAYINIVNVRSLYLPIAILGEEIGTRFKGFRPVHQIEVDIA